MEYYYIVYLSVDKVHLEQTVNSGAIAMHPFEWLRLQKFNPNGTHQLLNWKALDRDEYEKAKECGL